MTEPTTRGRTIEDVTLAIFDTLRTEDHRLLSVAEWRQIKSTMVDAVDLLDQQAHLLTLAEEHRNELEAKIARLEERLVRASATIADLAGEPDEEELAWAKDRARDLDLP